MKRIFIGLVVAVLVLDFVLVCFPYLWGYFYHGEILNALTWSGFGSIFGERQYIFYYGSFAAYGVTSIGLIFFKRWARTAFVFLTIVTVFLSPFWGLSVSYGIESMMSYLVSLGDGAILAIAFLTGISNEFDSST